MTKKVKEEKENIVENDKKTIIDKEKQIIVLDKGFLYENYDEKRLSEIKDFDINREYVIEGENYIIVNRDHKDLSPYIRYLLGNIEESKEMRGIKMLFVFIMILLFFSLISLFFIIQKNSAVINKIEEITLNSVKAEEENNNNALDKIKGINIIPTKPEMGGNGDFY